MLQPKSSPATLIIAFLALWRSMVSIRRWARRSTRTTAICCEQMMLASAMVTSHHRMWSLVSTGLLSLTGNGLGEVAVPPMLVNLQAHAISLTGFGEVAGLSLLFLGAMLKRL